MIPISNITNSEGYLVFHAAGTSAYIEFRCRQAAEFEQVKNVVERAMRDKTTRSAETTNGKGIDPAALLVAVVVIAVGPLLAAGPWSDLDTVVAVTVLAIFLAYSPARPIRLSMRSSERIAVALVVILICATALAWPIQQFIVTPVLACR